MQVERIGWVDSAWTSGWRSREKALEETGVVKITTVGYILSEDEDQVVVCMSHDAQVDAAKKYDGFIAIPKVAITKREVL